MNGVKEELPIQKENIKGAPARQYLNEFVTPYLLDAMKKLVKARPEKPLEWLGKYLIEESTRIQNADELQGKVKVEEK